MTEHTPGWYEHQGERRYWDGTQWTHSASAPAPAPPAPSPAAAPPPPTTGQVMPYAPPPAYGAPHPGAVPVARKEPAIALVVSFLIPGVGSMMNGDVGPGIGFLGLWLFGLVLVICLGWILVGFIGLPLMLVAWGWGMYHAYQGAVDFNRRNGYAN